MCTAYSFVHQMRAHIQDRSRSHQGLSSPLKTDILLRRFLTPAFAIAIYDIGLFLTLVVIFVMIFVVQMFYENRKSQPWSTVLKPTKQKHSVEDVYM